MRPFEILGVQQVAVGGPSIDSLARLWVDLLGLPRASRHRAPAENVEEEILKVGQGPRAVEIDLMQPIDPQNKPRVDHPPLHHVGLWVDDLHAAFRWLSAQGVRFAPGGIRQGAAGHDVCFIHPKPNAASPISGQGVLIELIQAPPEVREALK